MGARRALGLGLTEVLLFRRAAEGEPAGQAEAEGPGPGARARGPGGPAAAPRLPQHLPRRREPPAVQRPPASGPQEK